MDTLEKKSYLYRERDEKKRQAFLKTLKKLDPKNHVYIDEAGIDNRQDYAYGWSIKGTRCFAERLGRATERISMIAAYCQHQVFAPMTFTGYCNSGLVEGWFEQVLLPKLRPNQVVILDNASFHRKEILQDLLDSVDCHLLALPPYSPDFNKIEHVWHEIKAHVGKNDDETLSFQEKLDAAFVAVNC